MATTRQQHNQFQRGLGVYACRCCTRNTRGNGSDSAGVQLCDQCYELAGIENAWQDGNLDTGMAAEALGLIKLLGTKKDADLSCWETLEKECEARLSPPLPAAPEADPITTEVLDLEAAIKRIRALGRGRAVFLAVNQEAPIAGQPDKFFPVMQHIQVGRHAAMTWVRGAYGNFAERGAQVRIAYSQRCLFIG